MTTFRIAVFGLGRRIATVLNQVLAQDPRFAVTAYVDPQPVGLAALELTGRPAPAAYATPEALLAAERPDAVFVGSPNHLHLAHIEAALAAGVRVFSEKPVAINQQDTLRVAELIRQHGEDRLLVGLVLRSSRIFRTVHERIRSGAIGRVVSMEANELLGPEHGGFLMRDWRRYRAYAGSYLLEKCCHDFDLYQALIGAPGVRALSFGGRSVFVPENRALEAVPGRYRTWGAGWQAGSEVFTSDGDCVDHQVAIVEYANGARLSFHSNTHSAWHQRRWLICGVTGTIEADLATGAIRVHSVHGADERLTAGDQSKGHYGADQDMAGFLAASLLDGKPFPVAASAALRAGLTCMAIDEAQRSGGMGDAGPWLARLDAILTPAQAAGA